MEVLTSYLTILIVTVLLGFSLITCQEHRQFDGRYRQAPGDRAHRTPSARRVRERMVLSRLQGRLPVSALLDGARDGELCMRLVAGGAWSGAD